MPRTRYKETKKERVGRILKDYPETRDSDRLLAITYWKKYHPSKIQTGKVSGREAIYLEDILTLPEQSTLKRYRAHFQNDLNLFLPSTLEIARKRKINEATWRAEMGAEKDPPAVSYLPYRN